MPLGLAALGNPDALRLAGLQAIMPERRTSLVKAGHGKPILGRAFDVWWETRHAAQAFLQSVQDDYTYESIVPVSGSLPIPVLSASPIAISLSLQPRRVTADTEPVVCNLPLIFPIVQPPHFTRLDAPPWVSLGDELEILWEAPTATGVEIYIDDGRRVRHQTCHAAGVRRIAATHPGHWAVRLVAEGPHGTTTATRFVAVTVTGPRIRLNHRTIFGAPGTPAEFTWIITHARAAFLDLPARHERHEIGLHGALQTAIGLSHEEFRLTLIGLDDRHRTLALATAPYAYHAFLPPE